MNSLIEIAASILNERKEVYVNTQQELIKLIRRDRVLSKHIGKRPIYFDNADLVVYDQTAAHAPIFDDGTVMWDDLVKNILTNIQSWDDLQRSKRPNADQALIGRFNVLLPTEIRAGSGKIDLDNPRAIVDADNRDADLIKKQIHDTRNGIKVRVMKRSSGNKVYIDAKDGKALQLALDKLKKM